MDLHVGDQVLVTAKILTRDRLVVNLTNEPGVVKKVQGEYVYVETQYGTHYLSVSKVQKVE